MTGLAGTARRTEAVFPRVPGGRPHYESFYLRASHPTEPLGVWIRHTVHQPPSGPASASVWFTLFEAGGPVASKHTVGAGELSAPADAYIRVGDSQIGPGRASGSAPSERLSPSWDLSFDDGAPAFRHLPRKWMYGARVPRTKTLSPNPSSTFSGRVTIGDRQIDVDGWHGMVGHNWGSEHAERWVWTNGAGFDGHPEAYFDAAIGRVKAGRFTTPWIGNGCLFVDGELFRLGGPERIRGTVVRATPHGCQIVLPGRGARISGRAGAEGGRMVGWEYADPDGSKHNAVNCSIASMTLSVERDGKPPLELHTDFGATYELGMRGTDHGVPLQPFPDG